MDQLSPSQPPETQQGVLLEIVSQSILPLINTTNDEGGYWTVSKRIADHAWVELQAAFASGEIVRKK